MSELEKNLVAENRGSTESANHLFLRNIGAYVCELDILVFRDGEEKAPERAGILYSLDNVNDIRFSHENPTVQELYDKFLGAPLSELSHKYLHTEIPDWDLEMNFDPDSLETKDEL